MLDNFRCGVKLMHWLLKISPQMVFELVVIGVFFFANSANRYILVYNTPFVLRIGRTIFSP